MQLARCHFRQRSRFAVILVEHLPYHGRAKEHAVEQSNAKLK